MFHYDPNRELYLGFRKIAERMSAREVGDRAEEVSSSGEVSAETSRAARLMRNRGRRTKIRIDGSTSMNVRDHAPRVIKKLSRGAVELRDMCDPLVGRIASYSGFGMMGRRCREGDQYKDDAQDIQIWYSCYPDPERDGYFRLLFLHGSRKGNFVHSRSDSLPVIRSGSGTREVFDYIRSCSDGVLADFAGLLKDPLMVDRILWILDSKRRDGEGFSGEVDEYLNFDSLFHIESVISDSQERDLLAPQNLLCSPKDKLPFLSKVVVATPYVVQSSRRSWKTKRREIMNMLRRTTRLR